MTLELRIKAAFAGAVAAEPPRSLAWPTVMADMKQSGHRRIAAAALLAAAALAGAVAVPRALAHHRINAPVVPASQMPIVREPRQIRIVAAPHRVEKAPALSVRPPEAAAVTASAGQSLHGVTDGRQWDLAARAAGPQDDPDQCPAPASCVVVSLTEGTQEAAVLSSSVVSAEQALESLVTALPGKHDSTDWFVFGAVEEHVAHLRISYVGGSSSLLTPHDITTSRARFFFEKFPASRMVCRIEALGEDGTSMQTADYSHQAFYGGRC